MNILKLIAVVLLIGMMLLISGCHPWFKIRFPWEKQPDPNQKPIITTSTGGIYQRGTPSYVPLIDECMSAGGTRGECIHVLPPEELAKLQAMEAEHAAMRRPQMKTRSALNSEGGYQDFGVLRINLPAGWLYGIKKTQSADRGDIISILNPDGAGILQLQSLPVPDTVRREVLRNMTNVDFSVPLSFENWGDYSGYQYDYVENGVFYRQWWLANDRTLVFITYYSGVDPNVTDREQIDEIIRSLSVNKP